MPLLQANQKQHRSDCRLHILHHRQLLLQIENVIEGLFGKRLQYAELIS